MQKTDLIVAGTETLLTNIVKFALVGILLGTIGITVYAYANPIEFIHGIMNIFPLLVIGLVVLTIGTKAINYIK